MVNIQSKLPGGGITIFTVMSALATEHNAINLGQGFPNFDCDSKLKDLINYHLQNQKNQYCPMAGLLELREVLSEKMEAMNGLIADPNKEITVVAGATQGIFTAIVAFVHEGDEVLLIEPAYDSYRPSIELVKGVPVPYELGPPDYRVDWNRIEGMVTNKTRMIVINTPQNPIGKTLKKKDMEALQEIVANKDIVVLSDEVYEHLIYDDYAHQSVMKFPQLYNQSIAVYSFGKTFHSTGWKIGYCVAPQYLMKEFRKVHQWNVFCVNSFVQYGLKDYLKDPKPYLSLPKFYQQKRDFFNEALKGSRLKPLHSEGTYFQLFDYSAISDLPDTDFAKKMTIDHGVAAIPLSVFYSGGRQDGIIRLCFAKTEDVLEKAGELLKRI